ncbi:hypothetical protein BKK39_23225 [Bacillus cereus]|uniref:hypothetical protein n=1 Tax=Bacillus paranthracis TaxID=2026186 RepID=UPI00097864A2|nr:hypothetical protein BKK39_23225 [Bacillus cereus]
MSIELTITSTVITSLATFLCLHYIIEPRKENRRKKSEKFKNFYAPLYMMINARLSLYFHSVKNNGRDVEPIFFDDAGSPAFIDNKYVISFILQNSSYASTELLDELEYYIYDVSQRGESGERHKNLVVVIVKEYQQLRKELGMDYDDDALKTGIPKRIRFLRSME